MLSASGTWMTQPEAHSFEVNMLPVCTEVAVPWEEVGVHWEEVE